MEFSDGFGEDLMGDEADREYLNGLDGMAREEVLKQRFDRREDRRELKRVRQRVLGVWHLLPPSSLALA